MHKHDVALFGAMQTITLRQFLVLNKTSFPNDRAFAKFIVREIKRLKKNSSIESATFKYFLRAIQPDADGVTGRWRRQFRRYSEILANVRRFAEQAETQKTDRLKAVFEALADDGFVTGYGCKGDLNFSQSETQDVLQNGFVGISEESIKCLQDDSETGFIYMLPEQGEEKELKIIKHLQDYGFNLYLSLERSEHRLLREVFAEVRVVSFAEDLSPSLVPEIDNLIVVA